MKNILIPIPDKDFDLTEVSVPWKRFVEKGYQVTFATEKGKVGEADPKLITGVIFGQLGAKPTPIRFYREMQASKAFQNPIQYQEIKVENYDLLHLPGGHAKGIKQYLESEVLQSKVLQFFEQKKVVGSICHGAIVLARTIDPNTGESVVYNRKLTGLTKFLEKLAYYLTAWKMGDYYRTYPEYTQDEVKHVLSNSSNFKTGGFMYKPYVCIDDNLITSRWPEDAELYAKTLIEKLEK